VLEDGKPIEIIRQEVKDHLEGKLVLTVNGQSDFDSLGLRLGDFKVFEFHNFWKKWTGGYSNKESKKVYQPISLKRLYYHYFRKTIQGGEHSATEDALATVQLFREAYIPYMMDINNTGHKYLSDEQQDDFDCIQ
jgi:hypothetical protein